MKTLYVPAMKCGGCAKAVTKIVERVVEEPRLHIDIEAHTISLDVGDALERVRQALSQGGFPTKNVGETRA